MTPAIPISAPTLAVELVGLTKTYAGRGKLPDKQALLGIDLAIPRGSIFGLLGPNGAGKSTIINIMAGLVKKTGGEARVWGFDTEKDERRTKSAIGVVPQELNLDAFFSPFELLELQAGMYGVPPRERITAQILEAVGLADKAHAGARTLSGGMRRRLMVAKALVHQPPVLVLDEPTAGVDVELRQSLWRYVRELNRNGTTVLLTTHYLEEAQELCDQIAIIDQGQVVANESTAALLRRLDAKEIIITVGTDMAALPDSLRALGFERMAARQLRLHYKPSEAAMDKALGAVREAGLTITDLSTKETDLEDIFLQLTRRG
ncbi:MAG: ABC transporter ATP-binding protein [Alphaproteobacteria bacterium]